MKTLIVHPEDPTTNFLSQIYAPLPNKTVVKGGTTKSELRSMIESNDRILMLGHGSPWGLLSVGQFPDVGFYIVDESMVSALKNKSNSIYIWCHADKFVNKYGLSGFCTGMFISENREKNYYGFYNIEEYLIDQSNDQFVSVLSKYINEPLNVLYQKLLREYELIARTNPIARFNIERLYLTRSAINKSPNKVVAI